MKLLTSKPMPIKQYKEKQYQNSSLNLQRAYLFLIEKSILRCDNVLTRQLLVGAEILDWHPLQGIYYWWYYRLLPIMRICYPKPQVWRPWRVCYRWWHLEFNPCCLEWIGNKDIWSFLCLITSGTVQ